MSHQGVTVCPLETGIRAPAYHSYCSRYCIPKESPPYPKPCIYIQTPLHPFLQKKGKKSLIFIFSYQKVSSLSFPTTHTWSVERQRMGEEECGIIDLLRLSPSTTRRHAWRGLIHICTYTMYVHIQYAVWDWSAPTSSFSAILFPPVSSLPAHDEPKFRF